MSRVLLHSALLCTLVVSSVAQAEPSATALAARYSRYRSGWYVGVGIGGGGGAVNDDRGFASNFAGNVSFLGRIGWVARPWLLFGNETVIWTAPTDGVSLYTTSVMLSAYPLHDLGAYIKFGLGGGVAVLKDEIDDSTRVDIGFTLKAGLGYEFQVGKTFLIGIDLTYGNTGYSGGSVHDAIANLTLSWF